jgi:hypothetical protein
MKKLAIAVAGVFLLCVFATKAGKQNKLEPAPESFSPIMVAPNGACTAQGMGTGSDAIWLAGECERRETARYFLAMGQYKAALTIMCDTRAAKEAKACLDTK